MPRMFHGLFEPALLLRGYGGNAIRQQLPAIVQKALEDTKIPVIEIGNIPHLQRIRLLSKRIALILLIAAVAIRIIPLLAARIAAVSPAGAAPAASSGRTLLSHILCVRNLYRIETSLRTPPRVSDAKSSRAIP